MVSSPIPVSVGFVHVMAPLLALSNTIEGFPGAEGADILEHVASFESSLSPIMFTAVTLYLYCVLTVIEAASL